VINSSTMDVDLQHSQFGLCPRGDSYYSYRLVETMAFGVIPVIISDDWVLPFEELIPWPSLSVRVREADLAQLPAILHAIPLEEVCAMRMRAFDTYHRYLRTPREWNRGMEEVLAKRAAAKLA